LPPTPALPPELVMRSCPLGIAAILHVIHHRNPECAGPSKFLPSRSPLARATNFRTGEPGRRQKRRWPKRRRPKRRRPKRGRRRATADPKRRGRGGGGGGRGSADGGKAAGGSLRRASAGKGTMEGRNWRRRRRRTCVHRRARWRASPPLGKRKDALDTVALRRCRATGAHLSATPPRTSLRAPRVARTPQTQLGPRAAAGGCLRRSRSRASIGARKHHLAPRCARRSDVARSRAVGGRNPTAPWADWQAAAHVQMPAALAQPGKHGREEASPRSALRASLGRLLRAPRSALRASLGRLKRSQAVGSGGVQKPVAQAKPSKYRAEDAPPRSALRASLGRLLRSPRSALRASLGRLRRTHGPTSANRARGAVRGALTRRAGALRPRPRGATWGRPSDRLAAPTRQTACIAHMGRRLHNAHGGNGDPMPSRVF
jgi:hypothetical protein